MKYQEILAYSNIVTAQDAESSQVARMPQTYWFLLNNSNGLPVKSMSADLSPMTQSISQHAFVKTVVPRCPG